MCNRRRRIQILTLIPQSWSIRKAAREFKVSKKTIQKALRLKEEKGILEMPDLAAGKTLDNNVIDAVDEMYNDDEFTRQLPGRKDFVSVSKNVHVSKRLMLCNMKELYTAFKNRNPQLNIGFSKFASLRPKWCIPVGPKGTHSVCVCMIHQNLKLMLSAVNFEKNYHELIDLIVCDRQSNMCMVHRCQKCPGISNVKDLLTSIFFEGEKHCSVDDSDEESDVERENIGDMEECITYKQWTTADRAELISVTATVEGFIEVLCEKLDAITAHSYIAKSQANYLKELKDNLEHTEVIVLGDFAENYKFLIQDEIQSYHWNQKQCTLHPIVVYHRCSNSSVLVSDSICFISDDLDHDVTMVYQIMSCTVDYIKRNISDTIKSIHYFSDGCAGQYKNCKNFLNLCHHQNDFGMDCKWNFFATSHGKSPCDGIGGTVKRIVAKASLQRHKENQILTAREMFDFCKEEIIGIQFQFIGRAEVDQKREELKERFSFSRTVPGTRSYHQFVPLRINEIGAKRLSEDANYGIKFNFSNQPEIIEILDDLNPGKFVISRYDEAIWLGVVCQADKDTEDVQIRFMHPQFPSQSFEWPNRDDVCWVPNVNILMTVSAPFPLTNSGRNYSLETADTVKIEEYLN